MAESEERISSSKRFRQIITILSKYGLADWMTKANIKGLEKELLSKTGKQIKALSYAEKIRYALTDLGTTFIKLGQILSTRPDLIDQELAVELEKLQSNTPADPPEDVRNTVEEELGKPIEELFQSFNENALASASIGQVHKAVLKDGTQVVVKVQHKGIDSKVREDLKLMTYVAELAEKYDKRLRNYQPVQTIKSFGKTLVRELDFRKEARNLEVFITNFEDNPRLKFPMPYKELTAKRVLTMEFLTGQPVSKLKDAPLPADEARDFVHEGANMYLDMIFRDGFYHADPHPGNIFYLDGGVVGVIDAGMIGRMNDSLRDSFEELLLALLEGDMDQLLELIMDMGIAPDDLDVKEFKADLEDFSDEALNSDVNEIDTSDALNKLTDVLRTYHIVLPADFSLLIKVLIEIDGMINLLTKDFNLTELLKPYYIKASIRRYNPVQIFKKTRMQIRNWKALIEQLPRDIRLILSGIRKGQLSIHLELKGLEKSVNRLVLGILAAALFMGSTAMVNNRIPPLYQDVSIVGIIGTLLAVSLGGYICIKIIKS